MNLHINDFIRSKVAAEDAKTVLDFMCADEAEYSSIENFRISFESALQDYTREIYNYDFESFVCYINEVHTLCRIYQEIFGN